MTDLGVQRLCVRAGDVWDPEAHDDIGDTLVLEALDAVERERVDRYDMDFEGAGTALVRTNLVQPLDESVEFSWLAAAVHPAVAAGRAFECRFGVAADENRNRPIWRRRHFRFRDVVELAVEFEILAGRQSTDDLDAFIHSLAALRKWHTHQVVVLRPRAGPDAQSEPVAEQGGQ